MALFPQFQPFVLVAGLAELGQVGAYSAKDPPFGGAGLRTGDSVFGRFDVLADEKFDDFIGQYPVDYFRRDNFLCLFFGSSCFHGVETGLLPEGSMT